MGQQEKQGERGTNTTLFTETGEPELTEPMSTIQNIVQQHSLATGSQIKVSSTDNRNPMSRYR